MAPINLRDLDADRKDVEACRKIISELDDGLSPFWSEELVVIAEAALDEIDRLKRLLVRENWQHKWETLLPNDNHLYPTEADAWAAVRKAAMK